MARKIKDFVEFMSMLKKYGYRTQIPLSHLEFFIARDIGSSDYIMKTFLKCLMKFGFLVDAGPGIFTIADGWNPLERKIDPKKMEEAEKEANMLLEKVKDAKPKK